MQLLSHQPLVLQISLCLLLAISNFLLLNFLLLVLLKLELPLMLNFFQFNLNHFLVLGMFDVQLLNMLFSLLVDFPLLSLDVLPMLV